jgi:hypothetical protein
VEQQQLVFLIDAQTRFRVLAPSLERALNALSDWSDSQVDVLLEACSDVRLVEPVQA